MDDPAALGPKIREMIEQCRKNSGMDGMETRLIKPEIGATLQNGP